MKYKITIEKIEENQEGKYPTKTEVYTQEIGDSDMTTVRFKAILKAVNDL